MFNKNMKKWIMNQINETNETNLSDLGCNGKIELMKEKLCRSPFKTAAAMTGIIKSILKIWGL